MERQNQPPVWGELMQGIPYEGMVDADIRVSDIVYDSRKVQKGCLFVCLRGSAADGHQFAGQAASQGAAVILAEEPVDAPGVPVALVKNTRQALARISAAYFGHPARELTTIGLTGTKGKTTISYMTQAILQAAGYRMGLVGTIGMVMDDQVISTDNTTPESYELQKFFRRLADAGYDGVIVEASSIGLKNYRTEGFVFDYGLFSNFSEDHIGGNEHPDMEDYRKSKQLLFRQCRTGVFNRDDPAWEFMKDGCTCAVETFGFSPQADFRAENEALLSHPGYLGVSFTFCAQGKAFPVQVGIPGKFSVYNALAALALCNHFPKVKQEHCRSGLQKVKVKGRVEMVPAGGPYTLLIDYAHNALSMESLLRTLREYHPHRLVCLFGAGGNRSRSRRFEMGEVCGRLADLSVLTADNSRFEEVTDILADIRVGMEKTSGKFVEIPDRREAIRYCIEHAEPGDIIVLAGKGHEPYQEIRGVKYPFDEREIVAEILCDLPAKKEAKPCR